MKRLLTIFLLSAGLMFAAVSCNKPEKPHEDDHAEKPAATEKAEHSEGEAEHEEGEAEHVGESEEVKVEATMLASMQLTTVAAQQRSAPATVSVLGTLGVNENAYAQVPSPLAAQILKLYASAGDRVSKGAALAQLQSPELGRARAAYLSTTARAELAQRTLERKRGLLADRVAAQREVQEAEAELASAQAEVRASNAVLRSFGVSGGGDQSPVFALHAPISGIVVERHATVGQMTDFADPLFRIADLSRLWLTVNTFERDALRIQSGATANVQFAAMPERNFTGKIVLVGRQVDPQSKTIPIRIEIENRDGILRPGMSATASLPTVGDTASSVSVVTVPVEAMQRVENAWHVFIPKEQGLFEKRLVERGRTIGSDVEITSGLKAGETVVAKGAFLLKAEHDKAGGEAGHHDH